MTAIVHGYVQCYKVQTRENYETSYVRSINLAHNVFCNARIISCTPLLPRLGFSEETAARSHEYIHVDISFQFNSLPPTFPARRLNRCSSAGTEDVQMQDHQYILFEGGRR